MKILKFSSPTCPPCKALNKLIGAMGAPIYEMEDINVTDVKNIEIRNKYLIKGVPTLVLLNDEGVEVNRAVGLSQDTKNMLYGN